MESAYRTLVGINQSSLKKILIHPSEYLASINSNKKAKHFDEGSLMDKLVELDYTQEGSIHDHFYFINKYPSEAEKKVQDLMFSKGLEDESNFQRDLEDYILECADECKYYTNRKPETRIKQVLSSLYYYNGLLENKDKRVLDIKSYDKCLLALNYLQECDHISEILESEHRVDKVVVQFKMRFYGRTFICKAEIDFILIDHEKKIIRPFDLKTTSKPLYQFRNDFWNNRYDFQAAFYLVALSKKYPGYEILPFSFIVVEFDNPSPMVFEVREDTIEVARSGGLVPGKGYKEGIKQAFRRLKFHSDKNEWDYNMEYYLQFKQLI